MRALPLLALLTTAACADTTMDIADYDQSCEVAEDCVAVFVGETCGCGCATEAIHQADYDAYQAEWTDVQSHCTEVPSCAPCQDVIVECVDDLCAVTGRVEE